MLICKNVSENVIMSSEQVKEMHLKMSSVVCRPCCSSLNVLRFLQQKSYLMTQLPSNSKLAAKNF